MQAEELSIREVLIPRTAPAFSALGLLLTDPAIDEMRAYVTPSATIDLARLNALFADMEEKALAALGETRRKVTFERFAQLCYPGQTFDMPVPITSRNGILTGRDVAATIERFHALHETLHTYASREEEPILRGLRMQAVRPSKKPRLPLVPRARRPVNSALNGRRKAWLAGRFVTVPVYDGTRLRAGHIVRGPAIVEEPFTTVVIYPSHRAAVDRLGNFRLTVGTGR
jgi:N-methylhydantoinase A